MASVVILKKIIINKFINLTSLIVNGRVFNHLFLIPLLLFFISETGGQY